MGKILCYRENKYIVSQEAEEQKTKISLEGEVFEEGKNILHVFMEDEEGNVIPEYDETIEIRIDTQSPTVTLERRKDFLPGIRRKRGFVWYQKMVHGEARLIRLHVMLEIKLLENQRRISQSF